MIYAILGPRPASGVAYNIDKPTNHPCNSAMLRGNGLLRSAMNKDNSTREKIKIP